MPMAGEVPLAGLDVIRFTNKKIENEMEEVIKKPHLNPPRLGRIIGGAS